MGGRGSGSYLRSATKRLTIDFHELDLRVMKKRGWLIPNTTNTLTWSNRGEPTGSIGYRLYENKIVLNYIIGRKSETPQHIEDPIQLLGTPCHFGGSRKWFICPDCNKKVLIIYGGKYFRCRCCHNLIHPSVNESKLDRATRAVSRYQKKLAPQFELGCLDGVRWLQKPKRMRYKTFFELKRKAVEKEDEMNKCFLNAMGYEL